MTDTLINTRDLRFQLYEMLDIDALLKRPRFKEHNRELFDASLDAAKEIAERYFLPHYEKNDQEEPTFDGEKVSIIPEVKEAWDAFAQADFLKAHHDFGDGGMQLPEVIMRACFSYFQAANIATAGYPFLTIGAANLIANFAKPELRKRFLPAMLNGRFSGTMALTEPDQGSSLADIKAIAESTGEEGVYRLTGSKMFISAGDHDLTENIIHMVLAKIKGSPNGVKGISLFICPKFLVNEDGSLGEGNDVALTGLLHKMGYRGTTSTALNFGEEGQCIGYLLGEQHKGLEYMFQMMNEARIGVGSGAAMLGYRGYLHSLEYARQRLQGRLPSNKSPESKQIPLIRHADIRRMLLAQKAYVEGSYQLCLMAAYLVDEEKTASEPKDRQKAHLLLSLLTPIVKSYPSEFCTKANDLAIQILGGYGYTREYPVEQMYRDNRLNPIHEGTLGIQGIDLLGRKMMMKDGQAFKLLLDKIDQAIAEANRFPQTTTFSSQLKKAKDELEKVTFFLQKKMIQGSIESTLANATLYLDFASRVVLSWVWVRQATIAAKGLSQENCGETDQSFYLGKLQACRYFLEWELPQNKGNADILLGANDTCYAMREEWF